MGNKPDNSGREGHFVSFSDLKHIFLLSKYKIFFGALIVGILGAYWALTSPVEYQANASFREHSKSTPINSNLLSSILSSGISNQDNANTAISLMTSRFLIEQLVQKEGLQAYIAKKKSHFKTLHTVLDNLQIEYGLMSNKVGRLLETPPEVISVKEVKYASEEPLFLTMKLISERGFQLIDGKEAPVMGQFGMPVSTGNASFTLFLQGYPEGLIGQEFNLTLLPMEKAIQIEKGRLRIDLDREDGSLLRLQYRSLDRLQAANTLNTLMLLYQKHLRSEQKRILNEQLDYLQVRQDQVQSKLQKMIEEHAAMIASEAINSGFLNSQRAMEFLSRQIQNHSERLMDINLELACLEKAQKNGPPSIQKWMSSGEITTINDTSTRLRALQQQADSLDLSIRNNNKDSDAISINFAHEIAALEKAQGRAEEARTMLVDLHKGIPPKMSASTQLPENAQDLVKAWCGKLEASKNSKEKWNACIRNFISYISNLAHLYQIQAKAVQEHLTNQQNSSDEFPGLDLKAAQSLYIEYNMQLDAIEAFLHQYRFIIEQMKNPDFEISALSTILDDPISKEMINEASKAQLAVKDQNNRSTREIERLQYDLEVHRKFLETHIQQAMQLKELKKQLLQNKIQAMQRVNLRLTQQEVSVLQEHLSDHIKKRVENLLQEKDTVQQHQIALQQEVSKWPDQWVSEVLIEQQMDMNKKMVEEVTKLVESRNIATSMEVVRSTPIDIAVPPLQPKSPRTLLYVLFGAFLGALLPFGWMMARSVIKGMPVTSENLKLSGFNSAGAFTRFYKGDSQKPLLDHDLETLRHIANFLNSLHGQAQSLGKIGLILAGENDFGSDLAALLSKRGDKVLRMPLYFDRSSESKDFPGLVQYLEGKTSSPHIDSVNGHFVIQPEGVCRFANELLGLAAFKNLVNKLQQEYDWIILTTPVHPSEAEAKTLLKLSDGAIVTIQGYVWPEIEDFVEAAHADDNKPILFVFG